MLCPSQRSTAPPLAYLWKVMAGLLLTGLIPLLGAGTAPAQPGFTPSSVNNGVLLVASPSLDDPNFREAVVLIIEHGPGGTLGVILNRSTNVLLSEALPDIAALKGTSYRLFAGGPVDRTRLLLLFRLRKPPAQARSIFDGVYVGGEPSALEQVIKQPNSTDRFRAFAGYAGWGPGQLDFEMLQGGWATLPPDANSIFDQDPSLLWSDSISRLQAPRVISNGGIESK